MSDTLPPDQSYVFGLLLINISLNSTIKGQAHQPTKHRPTPLKFLLYLSLCLWFNSPQAHKSFHLAHTHLASDIPFHFLHVPSLKSSLGLDSPNITCVTKNGHNNVKIVSSNIPVVILWIFFFFFFFFAKPSIWYLFIFYDFWLNWIDLFVLIAWW